MVEFNVYYEVISSKEEKCYEYTNAGKWAYDVTVPTVFCIASENSRVIY